MRESVYDSLVKHRISTDVALRDIVNGFFEAGIGLIVRSTSTVAGAVLALLFADNSPNFPFNLTLAHTLKTVIGTSNTSCAQGMGL